MSTYAAIEQATDVLVDRLREAFLAEPALELLFGPGGHVVSAQSPTEMRDAAPPAVGLSVWLYRVERDPSLTNRPLARMSDSAVRRPPLPVNLYYLMTPLAESPDTEQLVIGKVLEVLNDHATFPVDPTRPDLTDVVRITLENLDLESITRLWNALEARYELSLSYCAQVVNIESGVSPVRGSPVVERVTHHEQILEST